MFASVQVHTLKSTPFPWLFLLFLGVFYLWIVWGCTAHPKHRLGKKRRRKEKRTFFWSCVLLSCIELDLISWLKLLYFVDSQVVSPMAGNTFSVCASCSLLILLADVIIWGWIFKCLHHDLFSPLWKHHFIEGVQENIWPVSWNKEVSNYR